MLEQIIKTKPYSQLVGEAKVECLNNVVEIYKEERPCEYKALMIMEELIYSAQREILNGK